MITLNQKLLKLCIVTVASFALYGCGDDDKTEQSESPVVQAVKLVEVLGSPQTDQHSFPAEVSAAKTLDISFEVSGRLIKENLLSGSRVAKGDELARIDPTPFEQRLRETAARLKQANRDLTRVETTYEKGLASQSLYDNAKTTQELAEIEYEKANQDLSYTTLVAPFDATVAERLIENNSYVRAGEVVARIQDISRLFFNIHVSERLLSSHQPNTPVTAVAYIASAPNKRFQLTYVEHDTQPDPITQTYKVVFEGSIKEGTLTPGARAVVDVTIGHQTDDQNVLVPFSSLQGNDTEGFHVWVFDSSTSQVSKTGVNVHRVFGGQALVSGGIEEKNLVVAAGASKMREGLIVRPYIGER